MFQICIRAFQVPSLCFSRTLAVVPLEDFRPPPLAGPETCPLHRSVSQIAIIPVERHNGDLMLFKLQAQPDPTRHAASATPHSPREIPNPGMAAVTLQ
jgi:hypothetical protein